MTYPVQLTLSHPHWQEYRLSPKNPILTLEPNQQYLLLVFPEAPFFIESANQKHNITQAGFQIFPISGSLKVSSSSSSEQTLQCFRFSNETKFTDDFHSFFSLSANKKEQLDYIREATTKINVLRRTKPAMAFDKEINRLYQIEQSFVNQSFNHLIGLIEEERLLEKLPTEYVERAKLLENRLLTPTGPKSNSQLASRVFYSDETVDSIILYMHENLEKNLTIEQLSQDFYISGASLKKRFKQVTGKSIMGYFKTLKIAQAERWLRRGEMTVTEMAEKLGFNSIHHFSSSFKKATGLAPTQYGTKAPHDPLQTKQQDPFLFHDFRL